MKKTICILLSLVMILTSLSLVVAADNEAPAEPTTPETTGTINDYLVSWWNFEGEADEQFKDKATFGATQDDLTVNGTVTVEDGVAHIPADDNNGLTCQRAEDLYGIVDSMTIYTKIKYNGALTAFADFIYYENLYRFYNQTYDATYNDTVIRTSLISKMHINNAAAPQPMNTWYYGAVTMVIDREANTLTGTIHISPDGINWNSVTLEQDLTATDYENILKAQNKEKDNGAAEFAIGKSDRLLNRGCEFWLDDVRLYNKALTAEELSLIQPNTLDLRNPEDIVPDVGGGDEGGNEGGDEGGNNDAQVTEPATKPVTTPVTTPATTPVTEAPTTETPADEKGGCGASVAASMFGLLAVIGGAALTVKKKD